MSTQAPAFTPEAVRDTLLAAGFTEHHRGDGNEGFEIGDGRENRSEILVVWHSGGRDWTSLESMWAAVAAADEAHRDALAAAGYRVTIEDRYVIVRETRN